jgi:dynactin complex subunit
VNNPKAGNNIWIGVEWDNDAAQGGPGKHQGTVDGIKYFDCDFHSHTEQY